jgi:hypothetical protein
MLSTVVLALASCVTPKDPDLDPQPTIPKSDLDQKPRNTPVPGQGGGALGVMPKQPRR